MLLAKYLNFTKIAIAFTAVAVSSCKILGTNPSSNDSPVNPKSGYAVLEASALSAFSVSPIGLNDSDSSSYIAIAESGLGKSAGSKLARSWATLPGVLPQILVPSVRSEISSNGMLTFLQAFPFGLGSSLLNSFASDDKIAAKVRTSLSDKLTAGLSKYGGSNLGSRLTYNFDHFLRSPSSPKTFSIIDQSAQWDLLWSIDGFWTGDRPWDGTDHGLQLLGVLRSLSEWAYLFGISGSGTLSQYGGLAKSWNNGQLVSLKPLDPSDPLISRELITGDYTISVPSNLSAVDLASKGGERWDSALSPPKLLEQSTVWLAAGRAFGRLRADRRTFASDLFTGSDPVLSQKAGTLPLIFLNNLGYMLDGPFIDSKSQKVFQSACSGTACELADARSVSRLTLALLIWSDALKNVESSGVDATLASRIAQSIPKIKTALQFTTRAMSGDLTEEFLVENVKRLRIFSTETSVHVRASVSAELIGTLVMAERTALNSEVLRERILALANGHAAQFFIDSNSLTSFQAVLWNARLIRQLELSKLDASLPWFAKAKDVLKGVMADDWVEP